MIFLTIVRRCRCETCGGTFDLGPEDKPPKECRLCHSPYWQWGSDDKAAISIRNGRTKQVSTRTKALDPGAASRGRQEWGKKQWRQFKPKPIDNPKAQS